MAFTFLRLNAVTRLDRHLMITRAKEAISEHGSILDFHLFSNHSICFNFELAVGKIGKLHDALQQSGLMLTGETERLLANCRKGLEQLDAKEKASEVTGTLQITFIHDEPDLRIEVPPITG
ncbi:MAG TPA: hypothetical protein VF779_19290 [Pyrinomonadaceae bacterium]